MKKDSQQLDEFFIDYSSLDDFQRTLIDRKTNKSMVVTGSAGSGKSLVALHKAKQVAEMGASYSIIVYTKTLRKYFADGLQALGLDNVYNYHQWCRAKRHVQYMIVDECQDFTHDEIEDMRRYGDVCFFFGDTAQSIMKFEDRNPQGVEDTSHDMGVCPDKLYYNYRLTKQVAALAEPIGKEDDLVSRCVREGEKPSLLAASSFDAQLDKIAQTIKNKGNDIAVDPLRLQYV